jgi:branched-chain amino acid transport system permease protein
MLHSRSNSLPIWFINRVLPWAVGGTLVISLPFWAPTKALATEIVIFALFGLAFNILFGYTGLLSFGHSAFFGLGAYGCSLYLKLLGLDIWQSLAIAMLLTAVVAIIMGSLCLKLHGLAFAFVTLAFSELIYFICFQWRSLTGGDDGLTLIPVPEVSIPYIFSFGLKSPLTRYYFFLGVVVAAYILIYLILSSPFGKVLVGIRENPERASFLGYNVSVYRLISFALSGLFSGLAGALFSLHLNFVPIEAMHWSMSGQVVIIALIGGTRYFLGPAIGSLVLLLVEDLTNIWFEHWELVAGLFFVGVVLFMPEGVWGLYDKLRLFLDRTKENV